MSEEKQKSAKLFMFWLFGTVMIVFAAITAFIFLFTPSTMMEAIKVGLPIWGLTILAGIIIYAGYYFYTSRQR
jgi:hypothetical protein